MKERGVYWGVNISGQGHAQECVCVYCASERATQLCSHMNARTKPPDECAERGSLECIEWTAEISKLFLE